MWRKTEMPNFNDMLSKAKEMQEKMKEAQNIIKKIQVEERQEEIWLKLF